MPVNTQVFPDWVRDNEKTLIVLLMDAIITDDMKITCNLLNSNEYIHYNKQKAWFEYEDGAFLGNSVAEVIRTLREVPYICDAEWYIKN